MKLKHRHANQHANETRHARRSPRNEHRRTPRNTAEPRGAPQSTEEHCRAPQSTAERRRTPQGTTQNCQNSSQLHFLRFGEDVLQGLGLLLQLPKSFDNQDGIGDDVHEVTRCHRAFDLVNKHFDSLVIR